MTFKQSILNFINQKGGNIDDIINIYQQIPKTGLYKDSISLKQFTKYCKYLIEKTKDKPEILDLKRKSFLEKNKLTKTKEYKDLVAKISSRGEEYQTMGADFEKKAFSKLLKRVSKIKKRTDLKLIKNPSLYFKYPDSDDWELIGEIDAVVVSNNKEIVAICEVKKSFDDIPDALFQINRSYQAIKNKGEYDVKLDDIDITDYKIADSLMDVSFIFSSYPKEPLNIQSKIKYSLLNKLHITNIMKLKKLFNKILKKKQILNKVTGEPTLRYDMDVLETIDLFKKHNIKQLKIL